LYSKPFIISSLYTWYVGVQNICTEDGNKRERHTQREREREREESAKPSHACKSQLLRRLRLGIQKFKKPWAKNPQDPISTNKKRGMVV
jgi:hypothetical protein